MTMVVSRHISTAECPWLDADIPEGTEVFRYYGYTYGCISPNGVPVTLTPDKTPFLEVPRDAVGWIHE